MSYIGEYPIDVLIGGTGAGTFTANSVLIGNGTSIIGDVGLGINGDVLIGNTAGAPSWTGSPSVSGTVTAATGITSTLGDITSSAGDLVASTAAKGVVLGGGAKVVCGTGDPNAAVTAPQGSLYLNLAGSGAADRAWINTNGVTAWTAIVTVA